MKKVKGIKERAQAEEDAQRKKKAAAEVLDSNSASKEEKESAKNVLGDDGDEDVIF